MTTNESSCIFEFMSRLAFYCGGQPDGESIAVYRSGEVIKYEYVFGDDRPVSERVLAKSPDLAKKVIEIIERNSGLLKTIPDRLNNMSFDGTLDFFRFGDKVISGLNIHRYNIKYFREAFRDHPEALRSMEHGNLVLDIYNEIVEEINRLVPGADMDVFMEEFPPHKTE
ncbi:MAG: hypothetical protein IK083_02920 [Abditibacteriota bacterium]|nr:hypothetical protein [Abditibacteriota bacterium]